VQEPFSDVLARFRAWLVQPLLFSLMACLAAGCDRTKPDAELLVFAAASTAEVMTELGADFRAKTDASVRFSFGASRDLARQVRAGAPADVLISADAETVDALVTEGLARREDCRRLASNRLVVIVPKDSELTIATGLDLKKATHVALGDPASVPAGIYAKKWLEGVGAWGELQDRLVPTLDVRAALAAVESGRAAAGIVYATDASSSLRVRVAYEVPKENAPEIVYVAARLARSNLSSGSPFVDFLAGADARTAFSRRGFVPLDQAR
jgi:molybdate transport system substrate-binding protein